MRDHLEHIVQVRPEGPDRDAASWALSEIDRLRASNEILHKELDAANNAMRYLGKQLADLGRLHSYVPPPVER